MIQCDIEFGNYMLVVSNVSFVGKEDHHFDNVHSGLITIEKDAIITKGTIILTHYIDPKQKGINFRYGKVHIKRGAFIGCNSVICNSCTIGENAIIGAGSIITKDVPANQVWAGNPARKIKDREYND